MIVSRNVFALLAFAAVSSAAFATDVTALDGSQGWVVNGTNGGGSASIVSNPSNDGDGALVMTGNRSRVALGYGDEGGTPIDFGTLGALAAGSISFDFFRDSSSTTTDTYSIAVKLFLDNGNSLVWENAYNNNYTATNTWFNDEVLGGTTGNWWYRDAGQHVSYDLNGQWVSLGDWASGYQAVNGANTSTQVSGSTHIIGISFGVGGLPGGTFSGAADDLRLNFAGGASYAYNFTTAASPAAPSPAAIVPFALGLAARLRRRKQA